ncbi:MAG: hypothetical protein E7324_09605 [Clostridiales bacterium]|nr:hypothetical protein [Clostridiales bacterium]
MDIQKIIEDIVEKLTGDDQLMENFKKDPIKTVTGALGIKLDGDLLNGVIEAVKGKLQLDDLAEKAGGILGGIKGLFGK